MASALIGYTGFVGGNLAAQYRFDEFFNSKNISDIAGRRYDLVVCAGAPAEKWRANQNPEDDAAAIARLKEPLGKAEATQVILISTVDVYPKPIEVDETTFIDPHADSAYARHRFQLERFLAERFDTLVVRLPALFGSGLKKNAIYDMLHDNMVEAIHADSVFQFYGLARLWADVERFLDADLTLINVATEPVRMREIVREAFGRDFENRTDRLPARYDFRTIHAERFGGADGYLQSRTEVLDQISTFVAAERKRLA